jgi:hypothetical protein
MKTRAGGGLDPTMHQRLVHINIAFTDWHMHSSMVDMAQPFSAALPARPYPHSPSCRHCLRCVPAADTTGPGYSSRRRPAGLRHIHRGPI